MQTWLLYSLIAGLFAVGLQSLNRASLKDHQDPSAYAWWFEVIRTVIFLLLLPFDYYIDLSTPINLFWLILPGLIEVFSVYSYMKMFAHAQLSVSTLISRLRLIWLPLFAALFLGEILTPLQYLGIACIFLGAVGTASLKQIRADPGIRHAFIFSIMAGFLSIAMKQAATIGSNSITMLAMSIPSVVILPLLIKNVRTRLLHSFRVSFKVNLLATLCNSASMILYLTALKLTHIGLVFSAYNGFQILSVIVGIVWFKESDHLPQKLLGTAISLAGILLLA